MRVFIALSALVAIGMITFGLLSNNENAETTPDSAAVTPTADPDSGDQSNPSGQSDVGSDSATPVAISNNFDDSDNRCFRGQTGAETVLAGRTIIVDPGHGGDDLGTVNPTFGLTESDLVLRISRDLRDHLLDSGANVCLTRIDDEFIELVARAEFANEMDGDVFVSVHLNSLPDPSQNYTMTMWGTESKDRYLSEVLLERLRFGMAEPAYHQGEPNPMSPEVYRLEDLDSTMLRTAEMPATLVEAAFLSNTWEAQAYISGMSDGTRWRERQIAEILHNGLEDFFSAFQ